MSTLTLQPLGVEAAPIPAGPTWAQVGTNLWVASTRGEFLGTVERIGDHYVACDGFALEIGRFDDLGSAKTQVLRPRANARARRRAARVDDTRIAWVGGAAAALAVAAALTAFAVGVAA
jgi:hypothetical protein